MHQAHRQWGMADGNDTTPMEVDAQKGKGKNEGKGKGKEKGKAKSKDKPKEGTSDTSSMKCFFCKEKACPKGLPKVLCLDWCFKCGGAHFFNETAMHARAHARAVSSM